MTEDEFRDLAENSAILVIFEMMDETGAYEMHKTIRSGLMTTQYNIFLRVGIPPRLEEAARKAKEIRDREGKITAEEWRVLVNMVKPAEAKPSGTASV